MVNEDWMIHEDCNYCLIDISAELECYASTCRNKELFLFWEVIDPSRRGKSTLPLVELVLRDGIAAKISLNKNRPEFDLAFIRCQDRPSLSLGMQETSMLKMGMNFK